jgi:hypothetical protein
LIYAVGLDVDPTFLHFLRNALDLGIEVQPVNLGAVEQWRLALPDDGASVIFAAGERIDLDPSAAYFCRLIDLSPALEPPAEASRSRGLLTALAAWLEHIPGRVVNRPGSRADNGTKPLHEVLLRRLGLRVPPALTASDGRRLREFAAAGPAVVKALSGVRADARLVSAGEFVAFDPASGPVHLQRYVEGDDVRVHVVADRVLALRIRSGAVDYRRAGNAVYEEIGLPADFAANLVHATAACGLGFAGWDFKLDAAGDFWCLEANPMPGYDLYDRKLGGRISESLLAVLRGQRPREEMIDAVLSRSAQP